MKYQFRPYAKMQPTIVTLTGKVYEKGEHPLYKDFRIIEVVDEEGNIEYAFEDELKSDEVKKQETLEEAAENFSKNYSIYDSAKDDTEYGFINGAKWQQEQNNTANEILDYILTNDDGVGIALGYNSREMIEQYFKNIGYERNT